MSMEVLTYVSGELRTLHRLYDRVLADLTTEQVNHVPDGGNQSIAFCLWHYVRTEDNIIQLVMQRKPTVWMEGGWPEKFGLDSKSQGTGFTDDEARSLRVNDLDGFKRYMSDVFARTDEYTKSLAAADLERPVTVKPLGEMSVIQCLTGMCMTHGYRHLGEIEFARGLVGLRGSSTGI
jgi:hypothetical protein